MEERYETGRDITGPIKAGRLLEQLVRVVPANRKKNGGLYYLSKGDKYFYIISREVIQIHK